MKKAKKILVGLLVSLFAVGSVSCVRDDIDSMKESMVSIDESSLKKESSSKDTIEVVGSLGLEYELNPDKQSYSVVGIGTCTDIDLVIPSAYECLPITNIGCNAFYSCDSLRSLIIGDSVTNIEHDAFAYCRSLSSIVIPDSVTSIGYDAFYSCTSLASITFNGTIEQWNEVAKGNQWNRGIPATEVVCRNGRVAL